ncbi:hypothetical protein EXS71_04365 [Candidatus Uhrbacteria bacterium]|nr:hypothetical protein [Candidatus Uhrbacteria bacterium]
MNNLDHKKISLLISQKLNETIEIISSERIGGGIHSDGYKLTTGDGQNFFLKEIKPFAAGLEFPERKVMSLLVSHGMYRRFPNLHPQSIGVIIDTKNEATILPELTEQSKIYHLQEFESDSESYWDIIHKRKDKNDIDRKDLEELEKIVGLLVNIHTIKHPSTDTEQLKSVYNDGLRSVITNPELLFVMLTDFPIDDPLLPLKKQGNFVGLMLELLHKFRDRFDRMTALHGDFSGFNVFIKNDGSAWTIDFSRTPWGDPGLDVGWFLFSVPPSLSRDWQRVLQKNG